MDDQDAPKRTRRPPSRKGRGPTPSSWKPGQSGNPKGRPRAGLAFAERVRERVDPDMVIELALRVAEDEQMTPAERLAALWPLIDRGYVKPPTGHDVNVTASSHAAEYDVGRLTTDEARDLLERVEALRLEAGDASDDAPDGETNGLCNRESPTTNEIGTRVPGGR